LGNARGICEQNFSSKLANDNAGAAAARGKLGDLIGRPHVDPVNSASRWTALDRMLKGKMIDSSSAAVACSPGFVWGTSQQPGAIGGSLRTGSVSTTTGAVSCDVAFDGPVIGVSVHNSKFGNFPMVSLDGTDISLTSISGSLGRPRMNGSISGGDSHHVLHIDFGGCLGMNPNGTGQQSQCPVALDGVEIVQR